MRKLLILIGVLSSAWGTSSANVCDYITWEGSFSRSDQVVQVQDIVDALRGGKNVCLESCIVQGKLKLGYDTVDGRIAFSRTKFEDSVDFHGTCFRGTLCFARVTFDGSVDLIDISVVDTGSWSHEEYSPVYPHSGDFIALWPDHMALLIDSCRFRENFLILRSTFNGEAVFKLNTFGKFVTLEESSFQETAYFIDTDFGLKSRISGVKFEKGATFAHSELVGGHIDSADLSSVTFRNCDLSNVLFEPTRVPDARNFSNITGLFLMTFDKDPAPLVELRNLFKNGGFRREERELTCAIETRQTELVRDQPGWGVVWYYFRLILFEKTCKYGMNYGWPIKWIGWLGFYCSIAYFIFMMIGRKSIVVIERGLGDTKPVRLPLRQYIRDAGFVKRKTKDKALGVVKWILVAVYYSVLFSLLNAFNIGFRDFNLGKWIKLLLLRDLEMKPMRFVRPISGIQQLASVCFFALFVLTYFGRPFE